MYLKKITCISEFGYVISGLEIEQIFCLFPGLNVILIFLLWSQTCGAHWICNKLNASGNKALLFKGLCLLLKTNTVFYANRA